VGDAVVPVIDLRRQQGLTLAPFDSGARPPCILTSLDGATTGILVDQVLRIIDIPSERLTSVSEASRLPISHVFAFEGQLIALLAIDRLLPPRGQDQQLRMGPMLANAGEMKHQPCPNNQSGLRSHEPKGHDSRQIMTPGKSEEWSSEPVYVTDRIPAEGEHGVSPEEAAREGIPTPPHLRVFPELGRGGMGRVHPATDRHLLRSVALKRLDARLANQTLHRSGFIAEAQINGQLEHPNIVPVHELDVDARGNLYFTMKLVQGTDLYAWLHDPEHAVGSSARLEEGIEILVKVCDAVAYAHHRGVIHRDIKPGNVMVAGFGQVYVMDWGLARLMRSAPSFAKPARNDSPGAVGTLTYMSPEQARGNPAEVDERTDIFGIGALLYEVLSGKGPYGPGCDEEALGGRARAGAVVPIDTVTRGLGISGQIRAIAAKQHTPMPISVIRACSICVTSCEASCVGVCTCHAAVSPRGR
jgi:hypothetical protein